MTTTLFELTYNVAREITTVREGTATGGSTTTIADTNERLEPDDYWNRGSAWILYDGAGSAAAPQGEFSIISDFANTGGIVTLRTTLTTAVASTDRYALSVKKFPMDILIQSVNRALFDMGKVPTTDITTIDSATNQTEYDLPVAANLDLREVWLETNTDDANDFRWKKQYNWYVQRTAIGTADLLVLPYQWPSDREIKIVYVAPHAELYTASAKMSESIPPERIVYKAAYHALKWYAMRNPNNKAAIDDMDRYEKIAARKEMENPVHIPPRTGRIIMPGSGGDDYEFEVNKVRL